MNLSRALGLHKTQILALVNQETFTVSAHLIRVFNVVSPQDRTFGSRVIFWPLCSPVDNFLCVTYNEKLFLQR